MIVEYERYKYIKPNYIVCVECDVFRSPFINMGLRQHIGLHPLIIRKIVQ